MDRQVIFRDRQELQSDDLNNVEAFADRAFGEVISDAITGERQTVGLAISQATTTSIQVDAGRLWSGDTGEIFALDAALTISVFSYLPVADTKWLAVHVAGAAQNIDQQPRDFLVDLQTGETEPQVVAMESARVASVAVTSGIESADPQKPAEPTGSTLLGYVKLNTSGIVTIENATNKALPQLNRVNGRLVVVETWKDLAEPRIATMQSDIADLASRLRGAANRRQIEALAIDVARLKDLALLPDTYSDWAADRYLDDDESDTTNIDWYARVDEGVRFPWAAATEQQLGLFNPLTTDVILQSGFILPAYDEVVRLQTTGYAGELSVSQYQSQAYSIDQGTFSRQRRRYGPTRVVCTNWYWWQTGNYDPATGIFEKDGETFVVVEGDATQNHQYIRLTQFWVDSYEDPYWYVNKTTVNISGAQVAQTFLQSQNGWLTTIDLHFTRAAASGVVYLHLCEVANGVPDLTKCIASCSVNAADLKVYDAQTGAESTSFVLDKPAYLQAGKRYALVLTTTGDHYVAVVSGTEYTQGTIFYSLDGAYYQGDFTKDLMMVLYYASFRNPRTEVELTTLSVSGGIADIDLLAELVEPPSTQLIVEYQKEGTGSWYPIQAGTADQLQGLPALVNLRAVFVGSTDLMPGIGMTGSRLRGQRPALTFKHISTERTLSGASDDIKVQALLEGWDAAHHTIACTLVDGANTYTADSYTDTTEASGTRREFVFTPEDGTGISTFQIVFEGTTDNALTPFHIAERVDVAA